MLEMLAMSDAFPYRRTGDSNNLYVLAKSQRDLLSTSIDTSS